MLSLLKKYQSRSTSELYDKCTFEEWQEIVTDANYHELLKTAIELYIKYNLVEQRENMWRYGIIYAERTETPNPEVMGEIDKIFKVNGINPMFFAECLFKVLNKTVTKMNCLRIVGNPNSGKTLIANCIVEPFIVCYNNNHGSENEFYLSNMLNKSIILCEELYVTIATCEDLKSVLGGQPIDIAKKFNEKQLLSRTPVIITSNYRRFGRGHLSATDENALAIRCHTFTFDKEVKPKLKISSAQFYHYINAHVIMDI